MLSSSAELIAALPKESVATAWTVIQASPLYTLAMDIFVALVLGFIFGYERSYHGRAAGMRTYGLVCVVSAAMMAVSGMPDQWYGGQLIHLGPIDPTRTIQGILSGIGFLGAGIIMKDGLKISGLTTAASIWAAAAIGVLVGMGYYGGATLMTLVSAGFVTLGAKFEIYLPSRRPLAITLTFKKGLTPDEATVSNLLDEFGYEIAQGTIAVTFRGGQLEWRFVAIARRKSNQRTLTELAVRIPTHPDIESFQLSRARN